MVRDDDVVVFWWVTYLLGFVMGVTCARAPPSWVIEWTPLGSPLGFWPLHGMSGKRLPSLSPCGWNENIDAFPWIWEGYPMTGCADELGVDPMYSWRGSNIGASEFVHGSICLWGRPAETVTLLLELSSSRPAIVLPPRHGTSCSSPRTGNSRESTE